jgi:hypothetical protein
MTEHYFLYIIPILPKNDEGAKFNLEESGWTNLGNNFRSLYFDPYTDFTDYNKKMNYNGYKWSIIFRQYPFLNSVMIVIECLDKTYKADDFTDIDNIFYVIKYECKIGPINITKKYWLKFFENKISLDSEKQNKINYLFSEIVKENEIHQVNLNCFYLIIKQDSINLIKGIKYNLFTLISLSEIAHFVEHQLLQSSKHINQVNAIRAFWGYKFLLLTGPGFKTFPSFFRYNLSIIDNLLDYCHMSLTETQNKLVEIQNISIETQNKSVASQNEVLKEISFVENGILLLTFFVMFDVVFKTVSELIPNLGDFFELPSVLINFSLWISLILALIVSIGVYHIKCRKKS